MILFKLICSTAIDEHGVSKVVLNDCLTTIEPTAKEALQGLLKRQFDDIATEQYRAEKKGKHSFVVTGELHGSTWLSLRHTVWEGSTGTFTPDDTAATPPDIRTLYLAQMAYLRQVVSRIMEVSSEEELDAALRTAVKQMNRVMDKRYVFVDTMVHHATYPYLPSELYPNFITIGFGTLFIRINLNRNHCPVDYILFNENLRLPNSASFQETMGWLADAKNPSLPLDRIPSFFYPYAGNEQEYLNTLHWN